MTYGTVYRTISEIRRFGTAFRPEPDVGDVMLIRPDIRLRVPASEVSGDDSDEGWVSVGAALNDYYEERAVRARIVSVGPIRQIGPGRNGWRVTLELIEQPMMLQNGVPVPQPPELLA